MSVNWQDSTSVARKKAYADATVNGEFDSTVPSWMEYADLREALIMALLSTGFPPKSQWAITEKNWKEIYRRLHVLERVSGCYRVYNNGEYKPRKIYFIPEEVWSMVGLSVNAGNKSDAEFRKMMFDRLMRDADASLESADANMDDPYWRERRYEPVSTAK